MNRADEMARHEFKAMQRGFAAGFKAGMRTKGDSEAPLRWGSAWARYVKQVMAGRNSLSH
ncbi:MAG TPA: hypothetical protein VMP86_07715 [Candidatus Binatia bacterium]|nr:hypothetical protein [Candidatus Binatia bacterium]